MTGTTHQHVHESHHGHDGRGLGGMALAATLHCLTGCAIGEISGLVIGTAAGLGTGPTIALSVGLAFLFGYALSTLPLLRSGLALRTALGVVLAADTLSIATMELVDNAVMAAIPGAMGSGLVNVEFWLGMAVALTAAFAAAYPVNRWLLSRGRGHALTHEHHGAPVARPHVPAFATSTLVAALVAFMLGGLVVSAAAETADPAPVQHAVAGQPSSRNATSTALPA